MPTRGHVQAANRISVYDPLLNPGFPRGLWRTCPRDIALYDPSVGVTLDEPFVHYDAAATDGDYVLTQATAGAAAISAAAPGVLELDSNSTTEAQGAQIQRAKAAFVLAAGKDLWFEAKVKVVDTYDKVELFIGLS